MDTPQPWTRLHNGVEMPLVGLGVYDLYGAAAVQAVAWALEIGYRLIDTAAMYRNEAEVGQALRQSGLPRAEVFLTTKVHNADQGYDATLRAFDESLRRLHCDDVDLYLIHWPLRRTRKDTWRALERLYAENRVRAIGVSNYLVPFLEELRGYASVVPMVNQVEFSPYLYRKDLLAYCRAHHIQLQAYSPLARGRRLDDPKLRALAEAYGKTPAQIMLRWMVQHGVGVIPKSASRHRLEENFGLFDFHLHDADMARLDTFDENFRVVEDPMGYW